jgi:hypothetical protein
MMRSLIRLVGSNEVPLHIRYQIAINVYLMLKNKIFKRIFIQDPIEAHTTLKPLYNVLIESCVIEDEYAIDNLLEELFFECVNILILIMSLDNVRYHVPGETFERSRIRQKAQDAGILIIVLFIMNNTKNANLRKYVEDEFFGKIKEQDIDYHFEGNHSHYQIVADLITSAQCKQAIDQLLAQRRLIIKEMRFKQEKLYAELRRKEEEREAQLKREMDEAIAEKRKVAQEKVDYRIRELQKA